MACSALLRGVPAQDRRQRASSWVEVGPWGYVQDAASNVQKDTRGTRIYKVHIHTR